MTSENNDLNQQDSEAAGLLMLFSHQPTISTHHNNNSAAKPNAKLITVEKTLARSKPLHTNDIPIESTLPLPHTQPELSTQPQAQIASASTSTNSTVMDRMGSFNRSESNGKIRVESITRSPGPAAAALASGKNSNKAIVAAAALAAAAATPLPVLYKEDATLQTKETSVPGKSKSDKSCNEDANRNARNAKADVSDGETEEFERAETKKVAVIKHENKLSRSSPDEVENQRDYPTDEEQGPTGEPLPSYAVDPDSGVISCICGYDHDDGVTIQCDKCFRWQHLVCMGFASIEDAPDDYQCNLCNENLVVDINRAKELQQEYLKKDRSKRRKSPYTSNEKKDLNLGVPQFKKRKLTGSTNNRYNENDISGSEKYKTFYYPIDYFVFKSIPIKSLFNQLPEILNHSKGVIKVEKSNLHKYTINPNNLAVKNTNENNRSKFTGISKLGLFASKHIEGNRCLSLLSGEIDTKQNYILEKCNQHWLLGCPKPNVFFHPTLPICIDQRGLGNSTRFIRKSCHPNCEIRTVLINKQEITFGVFSTEEIDTDQEITLPWEWDTDHPILEIIKGELAFENMDSKKRQVLSNSLQSILDFTDCGCSSSSSTVYSECFFYKFKKLQKSLGRNSLTSYSPTPNQIHTSIDQRYAERNAFIIAKLNQLSQETFGSIDAHLHASSNNIGVVTEKESRSDSSLMEEQSSPNITFKSKKSGMLYSLPQLPKQYELLKKYSGEAYTHPRTLPNVSDIKADIKEMPIPIEVNAKLLHRLTVTSNDGPAAKLDPHMVGTADQKIREERPKPVKKFSLADYKRKKTG